VTGFERRVSIAFHVTTEQVIIDPTLDARRDTLGPFDAR
jgi:hypothetical protein